MAGFELPLYATLALGAGPVLFHRGFRDLRVRRLIQNTPTAKIRSMAMGLVEICGQVVARSTQTAPFSARPCAYWELDIATLTGRRGWSIVHRNRSGHPFFVRDDTGVAMVYPQGADCRIGFGVTEECVGLTLPECYAQYMSEQDLAMRHVWRLGTMRFRERILEEGFCVYVLGTAVPRGRVLTVSEGEPLAATGTGGWAAGRVQGLIEDATGVIRRGENDPTFIISQQSERDLTTGLGLNAMLKLVGGPALTTAGLGYWLHALASGHLFR
ncbi:MAG: hypothetical protein A2W00_03360 [Candidatus Eisenbacteria bacterium RBG_16_71_46]|nr:MAG: hypothetical protein A2W00_03360 [Candidatus Eisenbacteria bacterium RBG_16_71_46]